MERGIDDSPHCSRCGRTLWNAGTNTVLKDGRHLCEKCADKWYDSQEQEKFNHQRMGGRKMHPNEAEFYDRLNKIDREESVDGYAVIALCVAALTGLVVGFIAGYFAGCIWPL